ncbi:MAG TPA: HAD family phosphatase [Methylomirabilota bacterium]|nr:HAD family phosphatase [Methylomirabilota bacterium]
MPSTVVFDLGNVLVEWNPRRLYEQLIPDPDALERFFSTVVTNDWIRAQDAGRSFADGIAVLSAEFPHYDAEIRAFWERWEEMVPGPIHGTVEILSELKRRGTPLYALTNWSAETFPIARPRFPFFDWFDGIVVSGEVRLVKPDARIYRHLLDQFGLQAADCVFIDDSPANVAGAEAVGITGLRFTSPEKLRRDLAELMPY